MRPVAREVGRSALTDSPQPAAQRVAVDGGKNVQRDTGRFVSLSAQQLRDMGLSRRGTVATFKVSYGDSGAIIVDPRSYEDCAFADPSGKATRAPILRRALRMVWGWRTRLADRSVLSMLSDRELRDIGLTRADADHLLRTPFWRR